MPQIREGIGDTFGKTENTKRKGEQDEKEFKKMFGIGIVCDHDDGNGKCSGGRK